MLPYYHYVLTSATVSVPARTRVLWIPLDLRAVTIVAFISNKFLQSGVSRGKTLLDWFFGFKFHPVVNDQDKLLNFTLTPGNTDDRQLVPRWLQRLRTKCLPIKGTLLKSWQSDYPKPTASN